MTTINRLYEFNSERKPAALKDYEWSNNYMRSFKIKHKRENCVSEIVAEPGIQNQADKID